MNRASDEARREWKRRREPGSSKSDKRRSWRVAKEQNEQVHVHFMCTCLACAQEFMICGLPCFIICPNCHLVLKLQFST